MTTMASGIILVVEPFVFWFYVFITCFCVCMCVYLRMCYSMYSCVYASVSTTAGGISLQQVSVHLSRVQLTPCNSDEIHSYLAYSVNQCCLTRRPQMATNQFQVAYRGWQNFCNLYEI